MTTTVSSNIRISGATSPAPDYNDLTSWEAGEQALYSDLVTNDVIVEAICYDDWSSGLNDQPVIDGWTTDSTHYIKISVNPGDEHKGIPDSGFRLVSSTNWKYITVKEDYTEVNDLSLKQNATGYGISLVGGYCTANRTLVVLANPGVSSTGINHGPGSGANSTYNNAIVIGNGDTSRAVYRTGWNLLTLNNITVVDSDVGFSSNTTNKLIVKNCVAYNCTTSYSSSSYIDTTNSTNNAASDGATNTPPGLNPYTSNVVSTDFADAANDDYHLSASSGLIGQGANLYTDFTTDIDGDTWPSSGAWDIGADYYVSAGGPTTYPYTGSGGAVSAGAAALLFGAVILGAGGATSGGAATTSFTAGATSHSYISAGGAVSGGAASLQAEWHIPASGGATSGGAATTLFEAGGTTTYLYTGLGGAVSGGSASLAAGWDIPASGGAISDGAATLQVGWDIPASGGATSGGAATTLFTQAGAASYPYTGAGSATSGGSAALQVGWAVTGVGGATSGGAATTVFAGVTTLTQADLDAIVAALTGPGTKINEIWQRLALDASNPLTNGSNGDINVGSIDISATASGDDIIQTRQ